LKSNIDVKLTHYSHGAGCGCKISPEILDRILGQQLAIPNDENLIVGNHSKDDAAVYDLGHGMALISTTDFFMPIVDVPFTFGKIAATNAISDIYAMGGRPILAIAILGWPVDKLAPEIAAEVIAGAKTTCREAGISLAGGHSIDTPEPIFGLAVNGTQQKKFIKQNNTAKEGDVLFLTKPIGVGILTTAQKKGLLLPYHLNLAIAQMTKLNKVGEELALLDGVHAMTDVTGFGLLGHLKEMCEGSSLSAEICFDLVPLITPELVEYLDQKCIPGGTLRNLSSYGKSIKFQNDSEVIKHILADPQTSGGLLIACDELAAHEVKNLLTMHNLSDFCTPIGRVILKREDVISVI
jgi:selenide, water dikinase